jgi:hypothetical protein
MGCFFKKMPGYVTGLPIRQFRNAFIPLYFQWKTHYPGINLVNKAEITDLNFQAWAKPGLSGLHSTGIFTHSIHFYIMVRGPAGGSYRRPPPAWKTGIMNLQVQLLRFTGEYYTPPIILL